MAVINVELGFFNKLTEEVASPSGGVNVFDYSLADELIRVGPASTPSGSQVWAGTVTLTAGAVTLALSTLARTGRTALDLTGLRVLGYVIKNNGAASMTFEAGGTNPYGMFTGGATGTPGTVVKAGGLIMQWEPTGFGTVGASNLNIDVAGTGTDSFRIGLVAGAP